MDEQVGGTVLGGDEAVALLVAEPLDGAVLAVGGSGVRHVDVCWWGLGGVEWYWVDADVDVVE